MNNKKYKLCVIEGDGIGKEVMYEALRVLDNLKISFHIKTAAAGYAAYLKLSTPLPDETLVLANQSDAILFGAVTTPPNIRNYFSPILKLRKTLDLYANLRPCFSLPFLGSVDNIDMLIVRENTEDLYVGEEKDLGDKIIANRVITRKCSERIIRFAFNLAKTRNRKKVTLVHKANVMRLSDGMFLSIGLEVSRDFPEIQFEDMLVDSCAYRIALDPSQFDVIVTTNMFGDILSDLASAFVGGLGVVASSNLNSKLALFEPVHGSAPDIAGKGIANPLAMFFSVVLMLEFLQETEEANYLKKAIIQTVKNNVIKPGITKTAEISNSVLNCLNNIR